MYVYYITHGMKEWVNLTLSSLSTSLSPRVAWVKKVQAVIIKMNYFFSFFIIIKFSFITKVEFDGYPGSD